ncbi:MAG: TonB-dependent receptor [Balneolaceae bacterium]
MKYLYTIVFFLLMAVPQWGLSQVADTLDLGEFVVTASKIPTTERETTKPVTIIERQEIERFPGASISELLNQQNGVVINGAYSSPGKDKSVYLRGASTQYTLILIDGFPVTDPSGEGGAFDLRLIPLDNVERIEIVKGSMSTLYGSDAIAGVINIITKKTTGAPFKLNGSASYGSFNTNNLSLGANGKTGMLDYSVNLSRDFTEGISEAEPADNADFKNDGYERLSLNSQVSVKPVSGFTITPFLNYTDYDGDYDAGAFSDGENRYKAHLLNTGARLKYKSGDFELKEAATFTQTERKFTDDFGVFNPKASLFNSDFYGTYNRYENMRFLAGMNFQQLNFELEDISEGTQIISPYVTAYLKSGFGLNGEVGLRLNSHSEYGTNWNYNIAPVYNFSDQVKLLASLSTGFKAPTLNELFGPFGANTDLKPQKSQTFDVGIEWRSADSRLTSGINYFRRNIEDLISYDANSGYININEQNDQGIEVSTSYSLELTKLELFYNYLDGAIIQDGEETDNLIRRPAHNFGGNVYQQITDVFSMNLYAQFVGEREDLYFNTDNFANESVTLDKYVLINLNAHYEILPERLQVFTSINNILNAEYTEVYGFNTPGIHFKGGIKFSY